MAAKLRNIIEDIAIDHLNRALGVRYDICTCQMCRNDMLAKVLSKIPAKYVTTDEEALKVIIEQTKLEQQAEFARAVLDAINTVSQNPRHVLSEDKSAAFETLIHKIFQDRGIDFSHYHHELLKRRVAIRVRANRLSSYADYLRLLINKPEEYDKLLEVLCINVSEFFRDPDVWQSLRSVLEKELRNKIEKNIRYFKVWSAGCAKAEEPFSIAILLREILEKMQENVYIDICATDIDKKVLKFVQSPEYTKDSLRNINKLLLAKYFDYHGNLYFPKDYLKKIINFRSLDLTSEAIVRDTDLVICRNVFIYYDRNLQEQILMKFYKSLRTGGYLMMGKCESLITEAKQIFEEVDVEARIFKKKMCE